MLELFADSLTEQFQIDTVFRLGGDEFVAFSNDSPEALPQLRAHITNKIEQYQVSASIGNCKTKIEQEPDKILKQADAKMYRDKSRSKSHR